VFEQQLHEFMQNQSSLILVVILVIAIILLAKGADMVVSSAVALALRWKLPKVVVGATVVSLGTTLPETMISVLAAVKGDPGLALGNAVGSIICDTGLILGIAATISPLPLNRSVVNRQGWLQLGAGFLLVIACIPWSSPAAALTTGGGLSRFAGMLFLVLLVAYIMLTIRWSRSSGGEEHLEGEEDANAALPGVILRLIVGLSLVIVSSHLLIPAAQILAARLGVPDAVVAATMVALGTSLPELVTALQAVRRNHGDLAIGNVIGADILNVLFVAGASAAVVPGGLSAEPQFFLVMFPVMLVVLIVFRVGIMISGATLKRGVGIALLVCYAIAMPLMYLTSSGADGHDDATPAAAPAAHN